MDYNNRSRDSRSSQQRGGYKWTVKIRALSRFEPWIREYYDELKIRNEQDGTTVLTGEVSDISAIYGLILLMRDFGVELISLHAERVIRAN